MPLISERYVFVYGTLRHGEQRDISKLSPAPRLVGQGYVAGKLYDLGAYPGVVLGQADPLVYVYGEVYAIDAEIERQLDYIEEVWPQKSGEYVKREVTVKMSQCGVRVGDEVMGLLYEVANERAIGKTLIAGGDWVIHRKKSLSNLKKPGVNLPS